MHPLHVIAWYILLFEALLCVPSVKRQEKENNCISRMTITSIKAYFSSISYKLFLCTWFIFF